MSQLDVCSTKILYDTEFEAEVAAAKHSVLMDVYQCGTSHKHYHLTHRDKSKSIGTGTRYRKCRDCGLITRKAKILTHKCKDSRGRKR